MQLRNNGYENGLDTFAGFAVTLRKNTVYFQKALYFPKAHTEKARKTYQDQFRNRYSVFAMFPTV